MPTDDGTHLGAPARAYGMLGLSAGDSALLVWVILITCGYADIFIYPHWTLRAAITLLIVPFGAVSVFELAKSRDIPILIGIAFLVVAVLAGVVGLDPSISILGVAGRTMSIVTFAALLCVYAQGRQRGAGVRRLVGPAFLLALVPHLIVGVVQVVAGLTTGPLATFPGRAAGLAVNPVYFGALFAAGAVFAVDEAVRRLESAYWLAPLVLAAFGVFLSGSRIAALAMVVAVALFLRREKAEAAIRSVAAILVGFAASFGLSTIAESDSLVDRSVAKGLDGRNEVWLLGWDALLERPLLGWGPGMFRAAVQGSFSPEFVRNFDPGGQQEWTDPHNIVVNIAVGTGLVGVSLFLAFVIVAARHSKGSPALAALAIALTWLFQPMLLVTAPLAALLLGVADERAAVNPGPGAPGDSAQEPGLPRRRATRPYVLGAVGLIMALSLMVADHRVRRAWDSDDPAELVAAATWFGEDPNLAAEIASRYVTLALSDPTYTGEAIAWTTRMVERQPERTRWWTDRAYYALLLGEFEVADDSIRQAIDLEPNSADAWLYRWQLFEQLGERSAAEQARVRLCALAPQACTE